MIFHLGYEIPEKKVLELNEASEDLTGKEKQILKDQIRKNGEAIDALLAKLDLFLNKEGYPQTAVFLGRIRHRLELLMAENDTFRKVLWKQFQQEMVSQLGPRTGKNIRGSL